MIKSHIKQTFGKASKTYDAESPMQKWTAGYLGDYIEKQGLKDVKTALEIGCGTGFLTEKMCAIFPTANWLVTDLSPEMLEQCKDRVKAQKNITFEVMDGEKPHVEQKFDLIVSSLAFQWFHDLAGSLHHLSTLLNPGGKLVFTTLGPDTFIEWRRLLQTHGQRVGLHSYAGCDELNTLSFEGCQVHFKSQHKIQEYADGLAFLKALKTIGAQVPQSGYSSLNAGTLRKMLNALSVDGQPCDMTYEILLGDIERKR